MRRIKNKIKLNKALDIKSMLNSTSKFWLGFLTCALILFVINAGYFLYGEGAVARKLSNYSTETVTFDEKDFPGLVVKGEGTQNRFSKIDLDEFWAVWSLIERDFVPKPDSKERDLDREEMLYSAIEGLTRSTGDIYTNFLKPEEASEFKREVIEGNIDGIGTYVSVKDGFLTIIRTIANGPAEKAGLRSNDLIIAIDGEETFNLNLSEATNKIRGKRGTEVILTILRPSNGEEFDIKVKRDKIIIPSVTTEIKEGVFIISVSSVSRKTTPDVADALVEFVKNQSVASKLILDLRGNAGGLLDGAIEIAGFFLEPGSVVLYEYDGTEELEAYKTKRKLFKGNVPKITILIDSGTASSAEIIAEALRYHGIGNIIGVPSHGKGSVQTLRTVGNNALLKITTAHWLTPAKKSISDGGIKPDIDLTEEIEEQIKKAVLSGEEFDSQEYILMKGIEDALNK